MSAILFAVAANAQDLPAKLAAPPGTGLVGTYAAKGVQIYSCAGDGAAGTWTFKAPEAQLFDAKGAVFARHYAGPTWEAVDGSKIVGKMLQSAPAPEPGNIPWLLLSAESSGPGALSGVRFVQRVKTIGGIAPTGPCTAPGERRVPYSAEYAFFR